MLKSVIKWILNSSVGRAYLNDLLDLLLAYLLKWFAQKHNHAHELPILTKIEEGLQQIDIEDFLKQKDDAEFRFLASRIKAGGTSIAGTRDGKIVLKNFA